jgi:hypothetical protein
VIRANRDPDIVRRVGSNLAPQHRMGGLRRSSMSR